MGKRRLTISDAAQTRSFRPWPARENPIILSLKKKKSKPLPPLCEASPEQAGMRPAGSTLGGLTRLLNSHGRLQGLHSGSAAHYICNLLLLLSFPKGQLPLGNGKGQYRFMVSMRRWNVMSPSPAAAVSTSTNAVPKKEKLQGPHLYDMRHTQGSKSCALDKTNTAVCVFLPLPTH